MRIKWVNTHKALRISTGTWYSFNKVNLQLPLLLSPCYWVKIFWSLYCLCFALRELLPAGRNHSLKLLFKESFPRRKAKLWNPNRDPSPGLWGTWPESKRLFFKSSMFLPARIRQVPILPRSGTTTAILKQCRPQKEPHTVKPQLTRLSISDHWRGTASGLSWGAGDSQGRLHLSAWKLQKRDQFQEFQWGCAKQRILLP